MPTLSNHTGQAESTGDSLSTTTKMAERFECGSFLGGKVNDIQKKKVLGNFHLVLTKISFCGPLALL